jgi:acetyltransferase-like isoleucine patch superfamily enzyme
MTRILGKVARSLARDRDLTLIERVRKGQTFVRAALTGPRYLRECSRVGARPRTVGRPRIQNAGRIEIGDDFLVDSTFAPSTLAAEPGGVLAIGGGAICSFGVSIRATSRIEIGDGAVVSWYSVIHDRREGEPREAAQPIRIGARAWLAGRVTVLPGATIGEGAVIAAGSVVAGEIPPGALASGVPARAFRPVAGTDARVLAEGLEQAVPPRHGLLAELTLPWARAAWRAASALSRRASAGERSAALSLGAVDRLGAGVELDGRLFVTNLGRMEIGSAVRLLGQPEPVHLSTSRAGTLVIGRGARIGPGSGLTAHGRVELGDDVVLEPRCMVMDTDFHALENRDLRPKPRPVRIGSGVRLGAGTIVLKGVTIGDGAFVEPGSVVRTDVRAGDRVGGVPARPPLRKG